MLLKERLTILPTEFRQQERKKASIVIKLLVHLTWLSKVDGKHPILNRLIGVLMNIQDFTIRTMIREFMALSLYPSQKQKI